MKNNIQIVKYCALGFKSESTMVYTARWYLTIVNDGNDVSIEIELEYVPAVEYFTNYKNSQIFLMADFAITSLGETLHYDLCLACYPTEKERDEKQQKIKIANDRLKILYKEFDQASIKYNNFYFEPA